MEKTKVGTLILSDIHLGLKLSRSRQAYDVIESHSFDRLILAGDIFENLNFHRLDKSQWGFLSMIRNLTNPKYGIEVVLVAGNHDRLLLTLQNLLGINVVTEYEWREKGKKFLVLHGDRFDRVVDRNRIFTYLMNLIYNISQWVDRGYVSQYLKKGSKIRHRAMPRVEKGVIEYAKKKGADVVVCGHTHLRKNNIVDSVHYLNTGCWTEKPSSYVTITGGVPELHEVY